MFRFLDGVKNERGLIESVFLKEDDLIRLIKGLESIGRKLRRVFEDKRHFGGKNAASKPVISFSAQGTFGQLFKYLYFLENLPYLITINKVSFQNEEERRDGEKEDSKKTTQFQCGKRCSAYNWKAMKIDFKKIIRYLNPNNVDNLGDINPYRDWKVALFYPSFF